MDITKMNNIPRKNFVLKIANTSNTFEIFEEKIWVIIRVIVTNTINASIENLFNPSEIIANQKDNPAVTVSDFTLGEVNSI